MLFDADFAAANACLVIIIIVNSNSSSSSGDGGGASVSDINSTSSSCGSSKTLTWNGKYKSGVIAEAKVSKYNLGTRVDK